MKWLLMKGLAKCPECSGHGAAAIKSCGWHREVQEPPSRCETCAGGEVQFFWVDSVDYMLSYSYMFFEIIGLQVDFSTPSAQRLVMLEVVCDL